MLLIVCLQSWLTCLIGLNLKNEIGCSFLRHEGYLGAVGAFLKATEELGKLKSNKINLLLWSNFIHLQDHDKYSWYENYAHSNSAFASTKARSDGANVF